MEDGGWREGWRGGWRKAHEKNGGDDDSTKGLIESFSGEADSNYLDN